jgi:hypothetical protein
MLGGCSGGGMGFIFKPEAKARAVIAIQEIMTKTKKEMEHALPVAMDPVVYDFKINENRTVAKFYVGDIPTVKRAGVKQELTTGFKVEDQTSLDKVLQDIGFDSDAHEITRSDYMSGKIGLKQNRLSLDTEVLNAISDDLISVEDALSQDHKEIGISELKKGTVGVVTLATGVGSRWTQGAGCAMAIHPFCKLAGRHRSFLEIQLTKSRRISKLADCTIPHVIATSHNYGKKTPF